jgi:hypothetical protein
MFFLDLILLIYRPIWGDGACIFKSVWRRRWYGRISGGTRLLELAADNREATPWQGARLTLTNALEVKHTPSKGVELDTSSEEDSRGERTGTVRRR